MFIAMFILYTDACKAVLLKFSKNMLYLICNYVYTIYVYRIVKLLLFMIAINAR